MWVKNDKFSKILVPKAGNFPRSNYTANIWVAKIAAISCVTCPVALWLQYLQLLTAVTFSGNICIFKLQMLQLYNC